ncbi:hydroxyacid dehydrogenase [Candidatus Ventrimonas sp.]|uniref:hydroxyacid dehydrogenase n=1 Tax=Candidatus Ventrimonas sp. TaxID=3048889 RepID=UPI003AB6524C
MAKKVLIPQAVAQEAVDELKKNGYEIKMGSGAEEADLIRDVADCEAILLRTAPCTRAVLEAGKNLKIVARHGAGYNNVDLQAANELGIWVTNTPDATTGPVAEFTIGAIIAAARRFYLLSDFMRKNDFFYKYNHKGSDLAGKTLGVVGVGRIGSCVAKKAHFGLDMKILAYDARPGRTDLPEYIKQVDLETLLKESDFVTLHVPGCKENENMISTKELTMMKSTAYLINCARGEVVDEDALANALRNKEIAGAFLDVMKEEPFNLNHPLFSMEDVSITPHMASNTIECMKAIACDAASQINLVLKGEIPSWPVNHPVEK